MSKEYTIHRVKKSNNFTIIHNEIYRNKEMSLQAMALHTYIMTLPDDWKIYKKELPNNFKNGETSVNTAWKELEDNGYIVGIRKREKDTGKFIGIEYHCYEKSQNKDKTPQSDFPVVGKPNVGNQGLLNTDSTKDLINKENTTYSGESKDSLQSKTNEILDFWKKEIGREHTSPRIKESTYKYLSNLLSGKPLMINKDGTTNKNISKLYSNLKIPKEIQFKKWKIEEIKEIIKLHDSQKEQNLHHFFFSKNRSQIPYSYFYVTYLDKQKQEIDILPIYKTIANILCKILKDNPSQKEIDTSSFEVRDSLYTHQDIKPEQALKLAAWYHRIDGLNEKYITKFLTVSEFFHKFKRIEFNRKQFESKEDTIGTGDSAEGADWLKESTKFEDI